MDYDILTAGNIGALRTLVLSRINDGWRPLGGVSVDGGTFYQAIVRDA
jgi:hypothetical protein